MNRRVFLRSCAAAGLLAAAKQDARAQDTAPAALTIDPHGPAIGIPPNFLGLSYEAALLSDPNFFSASNHSLLSLIQRLGPNGVLRIGGNSSDYCVWNHRGNVPDAAKYHVLGPSDIARWADFVSATGWQVIYGLNLGTGTAEMAAQEAAVVSEALGYSLLAFQIGNEPNLYHDNGLRSRSYHLQDYLAEWKLFADAVRARVPQAPLAGPDTSAPPDWVGPMAETNRDDLVLLSNHFYSEGPAKSPQVTIGRMLRASGFLNRVLGDLQTAAQRSGLPYRITEANSVYGGGKWGVSDTFASALWGLTFLFQCASARSHGINFHGGPGGAYTPIALGPDGLYAPRPLYAAMLLFSMISDGGLLPVKRHHVLSDVTAYAVQGQGHTLNLLVINTSAVTSQTLTVDPGNLYSDSSVIRLAAPSLDSAAGITLGGAEVEPDGSWTPTAAETVTFQGQRFPLTVPSASAVLVQLR